MALAGPGGGVLHPRGRHDQEEGLRGRADVRGRRPPERRAAGGQGAAGLDAAEARVRGGLLGQGGQQQDLDGPRGGGSRLAHIVLQPSGQDDGRRPLRHRRRLLRVSARQLPQRHHGAHGAARHGGAGDAVSWALAAGRGRRRPRGGLPGLCAAATAVHHVPCGQQGRQPRAASQAGPLPAGRPLAADKGQDHRVPTRLDGLHLQAEGGA
mmetsp:Transcript_87753/g.256539  ORF Transcript_87753/g.256539 Transcript_87753/m.256539 type:complete len:210 (-) Transcript_87753:127-756(-)